MPCYAINALAYCLVSNLLKVVTRSWDKTELCSMEVDHIGQKIMTCSYQYHTTLIKQSLWIQPSLHIVKVKWNLKLSGWIYHIHSDAFWTSKEFNFLLKIEFDLWYKKFIHMKLVHRKTKRYSGVKVFVPWPWPSHHRPVPRRSKSSNILNRP